MHTEYQTYFVFLQFIFIINKYYLHNYYWRGRHLDYFDLVNRILFFGL